jgi:hypothetical protein
MHAGAPGGRARATAARPPGRSGARRPAGVLHPGLPLRLPAGPPLDGDGPPRRRTRLARLSARRSEARLGPGRLAARRARRRRLLRPPPARFPRAAARRPPPPAGGSGDPDEEAWAVTHGAPGRQVWEPATGCGRTLRPSPGAAARRAVKATAPRSRRARAVTAQGGRPDDRERVRPPSVRRAEARSRPRPSPPASVGWAVG